MTIFVRFRNSLRNHGFLQLAAKINTSRRRFETLPLMTRRDVLQTLNWLLSDWPDRFLKVCKEVQFSSSYLFDHSNSHTFQRISFWLWEPVYLNNHRKYYAPSSLEIENAAKFLAAKDSLTKSNLSLTLGVSWVNDQTKIKFAYLFDKNEI